MKKKPIFKLNKEEKELSDSFNSGVWKSVKNISKEKAKEASSNYRKKNAYNNIKFSQA